MRAKSQVFILSIFLLIILNFCTWKFIFSLDNRLKVIFFDVGQGDSAFIQTPLGNQILIDGGPDDKILEKLAKEIPFWDRDIDLVILSHPEKDHLTGLLYVLKRYEVDNILWNGVFRETREFGQWQESIKEEKANVFIAKAGKTVKAGESKIFILYPFKSMEGQKLENSNDSSIICRLVFKNISFLFSGDATEKTELKLVKNGSDIKSGVLKIGHHGSKTSSSGTFLTKVSPFLAVISVGKGNKYGHPAKEVLQRLSNFGIKVLRTDRNGDIKIFTNGNNLKIQSEKHAI